MPLTMAGTVHVVDDSAEVRDSVAALLASRGLACRVFSDAEAFLADCPPRSTGCLMLDVRIPGIGGLDLLDRLGELGYTLPVIIVTGHADVAMAVRALKSGAMDFLEKPFRPELLLTLVDRALAADQRLEAVRRERETLEARFALLTDREKEILQRVTDGQYNKVIADKLCLSVSTVEAHRKRIMEKLHAESLYDLVRIAELWMQRPA